LSSSAHKRLGTEAALSCLGAGILLLGLASGVAFFGFGVDLVQADVPGLPCVLRVLTGLACPGCGMTRAVLLAGQLQWGAAWQMNPFWVPLVAGCALAAARSATRLGAHRRRPLNAA